MRTFSVQNRFSLSGSDLKLLACLSMFADHFALVFGFSGTAELIFRHMAGRLAFPIFAFLLVEGFLHTGNLRRYFTDLLLFAVLSELPYDLMRDGSHSAAFAETVRCFAAASPAGTVLLLSENLSPLFSVALQHQNTLFTLCLGLLLLFSIKKAETLLLHRVSAYELHLPVRLLLIGTFGTLSWLLRLDYGFTGMACIGAMYLFRSDPVRSGFWGCVGLNLDFLPMPGAFLSLLPLSRYNGTRGKQKKYFFYLFYPLHMLVLVLAAQLLNYPIL